MRVRSKELRRVRKRSEERHKATLAAAAAAKQGARPKPATKS